MKNNSFNDPSNAKKQERGTRKEDNNPIFLPPANETPTIHPPGKGKKRPYWIIFVVLFIAACLLFVLPSIFAFLDNPFGLAYDIPPVYDPQILVNLTATQRVWVKPDRPPFFGTLEESRQAEQTGKIQMLEERTHNRTFVPEITQPGEIYVYEMRIDVDTPNLWDYGWCSITKEILEENLGQMRVEFVVNGISMQQDQLSVTEYQGNDNSYCRKFSVLIKNWTDGQHQLETRVTFTQPTNDGWNPYPAGTHIYKYFVTVELISSMTKTSVTPIATMTGKDGMILLSVPAGVFIMGSSESDNGAHADEFPQHRVYLDAFWIDQTEVSNAMYAQCVQDGACQPPHKTDSEIRERYYGNPEFDNFPVIYVSWNDAKAYCQWAGRDLPSEAQWEKAARGTEGRIYPWGNDAPTSTMANYDSNVGDTTEVGTYPAGASIYGALDMVGNVWEWVNDWFQSGYYATLGDNASNPQGPFSGSERMLRGGSWDYVNPVRSALRLQRDPAPIINPDFGFRCALSSPAQ